MVVDWKPQASQDDTQNVYITFSKPDEFKVGADKLPECPFGPDTTAFTSPEDLMKNLPKALANIGGCSVRSDSSTFKISMRKCEEMTVEVGDKVIIEIKKSDRTGV